MSGNEYYLKAEDDFFRARAREFVGQIVSVLSKEDTTLLPFSKVKAALKPKSESYKGIRSVPVSAVVGSEDRYADFNKDFLPTSKHLKGRWKNVDVAFYQNIILPPVRLYEISGVYFVRDGNHRISVARAKKMEFVDAEVIELSADIKLDPHAPLRETKQAILKYEKARFCCRTNLRKLRPQTNLEFTEIGRYEEVRNHIDVHKYYINLDRPTEIPFEEALISWHDNVYLPIICIIEEQHILSRFPGRTESDLYVWTIGHWDVLKGKYGQDFPLDTAVRHFSNTYGQNTFQRILGAIRSYFK